MKAKRIISMIIVLSLALSLFAFSGCGEKDDGKITVAYSGIAYSIAVLTTFLQDNIEAAFEAEGWEFIPLAAEGDAALQAEQVQTLIDMDPDYFVLFPADGNLAVDWVKDIAAADIPVILINSDVAEEGKEYVECYVGLDNYGVCKSMGEWVIDTYGADAGLKIVQIGGVPAQIDYQQRVQGFADAIADTNYEILGIEWAYSSRADAQAFMENFITTYGDEIDLLVGFDDDLTLGGVNAIVEAGLDIDVVSMTGQIEALAAIEAGTMDMTISTPTKANAVKLIEIINALEAGEEVEYIQHTAYDIVTAENVANFEGEF